MSTGFPGRELGFSLHGPLPEAGSGRLLKRPMSEMERLQQQQLQHALFLRSVKQRKLLGSSVSSHLSAPPPQDPILGSLASLPSSNLMASELLRRPETSSTGSSMETRPSAALRDGLQELERRLLLDDDEEEESASVSGSAVTTEEWSEAMRQLVAAPAPLPAANEPNQLSSPTNSSSSTVSSSASSSPPSSSAAPAGAALRQMLLDTAAAIADGKFETATGNLSVLKRAANYRGDAEQRLTAVMVTVLFARLNPAPQAGSSPPLAEISGAEHFAASQMLYEASPCFKLGLTAANLAILEATKDRPKIHVIDFEIGHGGQYVALLHALADRHRLRPAVRPPALRITAVADPTTPFTNNETGGTIRAVGDRIEKLAQRHCLRVRFDVVHRSASELDAASLGCEPDETLAVNLAFALARVPDESVSPANPRDELLRRVRALRPRVVTLVEQEINTNTAAFAGRFAAACAHYGALLESLAATAGRDSGDRARVEAGLARRAVNAVAREGGDRLERCEVFGKWRARMGMAGFEAAQLGHAAVDAVKTRLDGIRPNPGFTVEEAPGRLGFGWKGRVLTVTSTWR
ncbi:LOW QUALITY PROTEIN: scarecrow-like protein 8 [Curcuma longa]|uniref:LOW QUALITY PROTEIN: scarecrow-like protein 8 n=1 Tax=Curcuma longa TaxID=136217 RepID=UPI003D9EF5A6